VNLVIFAETPVAALIWLAFTQPPTIQMLEKP